LVLTPLSRTVSIWTLSDSGSFKLGNISSLSGDIFLGSSEVEAERKPRMGVFSSLEERSTIIIILIIIIIIIMFGYLKLIFFNLLMRRVILLLLFGNHLILGLTLGVWTTNWKLVINFCSNWDIWMRKCLIQTQSKLHFALLAMYCTLQSCSLSYTIPRSVFDTKCYLVILEGNDRNYLRSFLSKDVVSRNAVWETPLLSGQRSASYHEALTSMLVLDGGCHNSAFSWFYSVSRARCLDIIFEHVTTASSQSRHNSSFAIIVPLTGQWTLHRREDVIT
jgi:hypothetical protein